MSRNFQVGVEFSTYLSLSFAGMKKNGFYVLHMLLPLLVVAVLCACGSDRSHYEQVVDETLAADRAYQHHASAVPMEHAVEWMESHGTDADRQKAYYVLGRVYSDLGMTGRALRAYQQAAETGDPRGEFGLLSLSQIGSMYLDNGDRSEALVFFRRTLDMATPARDTIAMIYALRDMACCLRDDQEMSSAAMNCLQRADELIQASHHEELCEELYPEYIRQAMVSGELDTARRLLERLKGQIDHRQLEHAKDHGPLLLTLGRVWLSMGQQDSARVFLQRAMSSENMKTCASAAMMLSRLDEQAGRYEDAWLNAMECVAMMDSVNSRSMREQQNLVASLSDRLDVEHENNRLRWRMGSIVFLALLLTVLLIWLYRRRSRQLRRYAERYRQAQETMHRHSEAYLQETTARLKHLTDEIAQARQENDSLRERLLVITCEQEKQRMEEVKASHTRQEQMLEAFRQTPLYSSLKALASSDSCGIVTEEQWKEIEKFLNDYSDDFVRRLLSLYPRMKVADLRLCLLLKLEFPNVQISNLFHRTQQATTNARKRLYRKLFNREGTADELTDFIQAF